MTFSSLSLFPFAILAPAVFGAPQYQNQLTVTTATTSTGTVTTGIATGGTYATIPSSCSALAAAQTQTCYDLASLFPTEDKWLPWDCLASMNRAVMVAGNDGNNDGPDEADEVIDALQATAQSAGFDPRIALAVVMQESDGFVRPGQGDNGASYGIFQVQLQKQYQPPANCIGTALNECPQSNIQAMAEDGIYGHNGTTSPPVEPGLGYWLTTENENIGLSLRAYNTGSIPDATNLTMITLTNCAGKKYFAGTQTYVTDVANRLTGAISGWKHPETCSLDIQPNDFTSLGSGCQTG